MSLLSRRNERKAFTLAEVLITLGIIGVIAALTISSIVSHYQEKQTISQLKKSYSLLSQAFASAINDNGTIDGWCERGDFDACSVIMNDIIQPYFSVVRKCFSVDKKCFAYKYRHLNDSRELSLTYERSQFLVNDGASFMILASAGSNHPQNWCKNFLSDTTNNYFFNCGYAYVDVNGPKRPNVLGRDVFIFKIYKDGIRPGGTPADDIWTEEFKNQCLGQAGGLGDDEAAWCAGWVLINENMDYLHCKDLDWETKTSCK